jgi:peptidoglycan L-alanyl-D-glutamate endopeptidase CwlK
MYRYSRRSKGILSQVDSQLQELFNEVIKHEDITITSGIRTAEEQKELFTRGRSSKDGYAKRSKHQEGKAVDFCAYGSRASFDSDDNHFIAGVIVATARTMGIKIRTGSRWSRKLCSETTLHDPFHIELV